MHRRVQRLDPAVHHLGKAGHLGHVAHAQPRLAQRPAPCRRWRAARPRARPAPGQGRPGRSCRKRKSARGGCGTRSVIVGSCSAVVSSCREPRRPGRGRGSPCGVSCALASVQLMLAGIVASRATDRTICLRRARLQPAVFQIDRRLERQSGVAVVAEHPDLAALQRQRHRGAAHVERRRPRPGAGESAARRRSPCSLAAVHRPVEARRSSSVNAPSVSSPSSAAAVEGQIQPPHMGQPVGRGIAVMAGHQAAALGAALCWMRTTSRGASISSSRAAPADQPAGAEPRRGIALDRQGGMRGRRAAGAAPVRPERRRPSRN